MPPNVNVGHRSSSSGLTGSKGESEQNATAPVDISHVQIGLFWVESQLKPSSTATLDQYHQWCNGELIPTVVASRFPGGPRTVVRYKNETATSPKNQNSFAFLHLSPESDLLLMHSPLRSRALSLTRGVPTKAFNGDTALQHIDFNNVGYRYLRTLGSEYGRQITSEGLDAFSLTMVADFFETPHTQKLGIREEALFMAEYQLPKQFETCEHHWRSLEYKLLQGKAPRYLVLHFFDSEHTTLGEDVLTAGADECLERRVYSLLYAGGDMIYPPERSSEELDTAETSTSPRLLWLEDMLKHPPSAHSEGT